MYTRIVTFTMAETTAEDYRSQAAAIADSFNQWPHLLAKLWIGDAATHRYGGIYLFTDAEAADATRQTPQFTALTENPAITGLCIEEFDLYPELCERTAPSLLDAVGVRT